MKTKVFGTSIANATILSALTMLFVTGCGAIGSKQKTAAQEGGDITRPPSLVKGARKTQSESNPDETVSYDEWRKRRNNAPVSSDSGTELEEIKKLETPEEPIKIP